MTEERIDLAPRIVRERAVGLDSRRGRTPPKTPAKQSSRPTFALAQLAAERPSGVIPRMTAERLGWELARAILATSDPWTLQGERTFPPVNYWASRDTIRAPRQLHIRIDDLEALQVGLLTTKYAGTQGTDSVGQTAVSTGPTFVRNTQPDPLDILPLCSRIPGSFGESRVALLDTPDAAMASEPGDIGYAISRDGRTNGISLTPNAVVVNLRITRVAEVSQRNLVVALTLAGMLRLKEKFEQQIVAGDGVAPNLPGLYNDTTIPNSADLTGLGDLTADVVRTGLSGPLLGRNPRLLLAREAQIALRGVAGGITGVVKPVLSAEGRVDNVPSMRTGYLDAGGTKNTRALGVALGELYYKIWSDAVVAEATYVDGVYWVTLMLFVDYALPVKAYAYRYIQP